MPCPEPNREYPLTDLATSVPLCPCGGVPEVVETPFRWFIICQRCGRKTPKAASLAGARHFWRSVVSHS